MLAFIANRLLASIPVLLTVAVFVFLLLRLTPGDPAAAIGGDSATAEQIADIRNKLGLDQPIIEQFVTWAGRTATGDLGESFFFKKTVSELIAQRIEPTLSLSVVTVILAVLIAVPLGVLAAHHHGSVLDRCLMGFSVMGFSVPVFVIGYFLIYVFAVKLNLLPVQGTLAVIYVALIARMTRASVIEVLREDYIRTARAKGLTNGAVLVRHALRNAAVPIVTVIGIGIALLIGGVVVTESVYNIPGLGRLTVDAVLARDYPVIQGIILLFSFVYVLINLAIDIAYTMVDPRIRY